MHTVASAIRSSLGRAVVLAIRPSGSTKLRPIDMTAHAWSHTSGTCVLLGTKLTRRLTSNLDEVRLPPNVLA